MSSSEMSYHHHYTGQERVKFIFSKYVLLAFKKNNYELSIKRATPSRIGKHHLTCHFVQFFHSAQV